jgi:hypothetical protein
MSDDCASLSLCEETLLDTASGGCRGRYGPLGETVSTVYPGKSKTVETVQCRAPNTSMNRGVNESRITMREPGASFNHTLRHGGKDTIFK